MSDIIQLSGKIAYGITLDPSVWIFDDRKIEFEKCFNMATEEEDEIEKYTKAISEQWDRERKNGAMFPPVNRSINRKEKNEILNGSYVMPFRPFIEHASPTEKLSLVRIKHKNDQMTEIEYSKVKDAFLCFALNGKPLNEDGPVHLYFKDGSNRDNPIKNIVSFIFE